MKAGRRFPAALAALLGLLAGATVPGAVGSAAAQEAAADTSRASGGTHRAAARETRSGGLYGWGPHVGLGGDPDQLLIGIHFDVGRIAPRVRFQPDVELGLGDNHTLFEFTLPAHYLFRARTDVRPYAGGGLVVGLDDRDRPNTQDDTDVEIAIALTGGLEWRTSHGDRFFLELSLQAGDLHDFQVTGGVTF